MYAIRSYYGLDGNAPSTRGIQQSLKPHTINVELKTKDPIVYTESDRVLNVFFGLHGDFLKIDGLSGRKHLLQVKNHQEVIVVATDAEKKFRPLPF